MLENDNLPISRSVIEHESFAKQTPEFYALAKVAECVIDDVIDTSLPSIDTSVFPYILDCLSLPPIATRFDAEITKYHLDILTDIMQNQPKEN